MNLYVASRAVGVLCVLIMLGPSRLNGSHVVRYAVACQTKLVDRAEPQQPWIGRAVWGVTSRAPFGFERRVFIDKRTLLVSMTLDTRGIGAGRQPCLLKFKTAVWVMAVAALHYSFENFVVEGLVKVRLRFGMTTHTKLRLANLQHMQCREIGFLSVSFRFECDRACQIQPGWIFVWRVTLSAADIVSPVLAASKVISLFFAGVT